MGGRAQSIQREITQEKNALFALYTPLDSSVSSKLKSSVWAVAHKWTRLGIFSLVPKRCKLLHSQVWGDYAGVSWQKCLRRFDGNGKWKRQFLTLHLKWRGDNKGCRWWMISLLHGREQELLSEYYLPLILGQTLISLVKKYQGSIWLKCCRWKLALYILGQMILTLSKAICLILTNCLRFLDFLSPSSIY